ncbi:hypothetical protein GCM10010124_11460 [Pilimelia terevasa]|uniref:DUF4360 domain-containing protein n=1 Tax=Pilimelia terevasa TaxID=53372 RepID=A0A8J3BHS5_9ACTN|nr:DUF4360 domain-containing protein [Pilimelia terevasa]GGK20558.1 hypothetical protein GCM10010124_11460 [Pilimelia terevasa]
MARLVAAIATGVLLCSTAQPALADAGSTAAVRFVFGGASGTGCAPDTVDVTELPNGGLRVYTSGIKVKADVPQVRCVMRIRTEAPAGWSYSLPVVRYRGDMMLYKDVSARISTTISFSGSAEQTSTGFTLADARGDFDITHQAPPDALVFKPCGADVTMNISTMAALADRPAKTPSRLAVRSLEISPDDLVWRECPPV